MRQGNKADMGGGGGGGWNSSGKMLKAQLCILKGPYMFWMEDGFDGYEDEDEEHSPKAHEHRLRSSNVTSRKIQFELRTTEFAGKFPCKCYEKGASKLTS